MDDVMRQEKEHLSKVISAIDDSVSQLETRYDIAKKQAMSPCYDNDDLQTRQYYIGEAEQLKYRIKEEASHRESPYFAHMELDYNPTPNLDDDGIAIKDIYVGKPGFQAGDKIIVDWRAPLGQIYYQKAQRKFSINQQTYTLLMRRALQISHGELFRYNTEFDSADVSLEGQIVDPFLMTVLKDKRRQHRLTDIIATIQENQNAIIARPYKENFVVQGCAGSGKTMILLHRLSYLLFNNKFLKPGNIKILTPNQYFTTFIDDLSEELGLHEIQRLTIEEYYVRLIRAYSSKIDVKPGVTTEMGLPSEFLEKLYSIEFLKSLQQQYDQFCDAVLEKLDIHRVWELSAQLGKYRKPDLAAHKYEEFYAAEQVVLELAADFKRRIEKRDRLAESAGAIENSIARAQIRLEKQTDQLKVLADGLCEHLGRICSDAEAYISDAQKEKNEIDQQLKEIQPVSPSTIQEVKDLEQKLAEAKKGVSQCRDYESLMDSTSVISRHVKEHNQALLAEIAQVQEELRKIPVFNFTKRNRYVKRSTQLHEDLNVGIEEAVSEYLLQLEQELNQAKANLPSLPDDVKNLKERSKYLWERLRRSEDIIRAGTAVIRTLEDDPENNIEDSLTENWYAILENILKPYEAAQNAIGETREHIQKEMESLEVCREKLEESETEIPEEDDWIAVTRAKNGLEELHFQNVRKKILKTELDALADRYGVKKEKQYRHDLYLLLALCVMYFRKPNISDNFLNIDEAQDLAVAEYAVLYGALGSGCIFNLYGDVNQLVYDYKGIWDWDDISYITGGKLFVLNENYRNTLQITDYCNDVFGAEVYPIGVSGAEVEELPLSVALNKFRENVAMDRSARSVILIGNQDRTNKALQDVTFKCGFHWLEASASGISVLTAEMAKGLEFDRVLVIEAHMNENEQYISFTRAMEKLIVAKE